jgi:hypothetical protein
MPKKDTRKILIPEDPSNPDLKVVHFQHNGIDKYVVLGKVTVVPDWLFENNPLYAKYEVK